MKYINPVVRGFYPDPSVTTADWEYELSGDFLQEGKQLFTFENTDWKIDWSYLRHPVTKNYELEDHRAILHGSSVTLDNADTPTFIGLRQKDFNMNLEAELVLDTGEAGITVYSCEREHYDVALRKTGNGFEVLLRLNIGGIYHEQTVFPIEGKKVRLIVRADSERYIFSFRNDEIETELGIGYSKYLSSEVCGGFTGVMLGLYAVGKNSAEFSNLRLEYLPWKPEHFHA